MKTRLPDWLRKSRQQFRIPVFRRPGLSWWNSLSAEFTRGCLTVQVLGVMMSPVMGQVEGGDEEQIRQQLDEVLQQPEFDRLRLELEPLNVPTPTWWDRFVDWLQNLAPDWNPGPVWSGVVEFLKLLPTILGVILAAVIIWLIIRAVNNWRARRIDQLSKLSSLNLSIGTTPPGEIPADEYLRRARLAAANGIWSEAIAQLLLGTLSATERQGLIRFRKGLTYRDYRRALRRIPRAAEPFQHLVRLYLPIGFGRRPASGAMFDEALRDYELCVGSLAAGPDETKRSEPVPLPESKSPAAETTVTS